MNRNYILFDDEKRVNLLPFTFTRPASEIRVGILTITEKWEKYLGQKPSFFTVDFLSGKYPALKTNGEVCLVNGRIAPNLDLLKAIQLLKQEEAIVKEGTIIAAVLKGTPSKLPEPKNFSKVTEYSGTFFEVKNVWDIFRSNGDELLADFQLITKGRKSQSISSTNRIIHPENIFVEEGAKVECAILNAENGPIYIGADSEIMEGAIIRGPFAICEHSAVKMGAKVYGPTTVGPHSKIGGEVNNSVIFGYSNKAHDGFLGNSVIGEWCNIGADSNNSNLKNNYAQVKLWNYSENHFAKTGLQFCGLFMGDHSKCGINTMFNTGTVVGVCANIFGSGFPRNFIPSFSWGGANGFMVHQVAKAIETAEIMMARRSLNLTQTDRTILQHIFDITACYRNF